MIPTSVENMNLNISAVTVMGIIHGIMVRPLMGFAKENFLQNKRASKKPIRNWKTRQATVNNKVFPIAFKNTPSLKMVT
jgi:hypothetical protein